MANRSKLKKAGTLGCGILITLSFLVLGSVVYVLRTVNVDYKEVRHSQDLLEREHGNLAEYTPAGSGVPTAARIEAFLAVRRAQAERRGALAVVMQEFQIRQAENEKGGPLAFFRLARNMGDLAGQLARYWVARNEVMLEQDMGPGEYAYLYGLAYHAYLGNDPSDGARDVRYDYRRDMAPVQIETHGRMDEGERRDEAWARIHDLLTPMLTRIDPQAVTDDQWRLDLALEVDLLAASPLRYPWRDGVPRALSDAFRPFRRDLELNYDVATNPLELIFEETNQE